MQSPDNIAVIGDGPVEEWVAVSGGTFVRSTFDLPALLFDAQLLHLYGALLHLEGADLFLRFEKDRTRFLEYLKDEVGLASLADRQHLANALGRAKRLGLYESQSSTPQPAAKQ